MAPPRKYPAGREPWTLAGVTKKTWQRKQRESRMTPAELDAYRDRMRAHGAGGDGALQSEAEIVAAVSPCEERDPASGGERL